MKVIISNALILLVNISAGGNGVEIEWSLLVVLTDCKHDLDGVTPSTLGKTVT
jgi:hypothetical protein